MSILIKGMEMPKACVYRENGHLITCPLYDIDGYCGALNTEASHKENGKLSDCPLVPVPKHGRLIEERRVLDIVYEWCPDDDGSVGKDGDLREMLDEIEAIPTIIEAEGEG
jgi:hypothetical protein